MSAHFRAKKIYTHVTTWPYHLCLLTLTSAAKNYDGWWELDYFDNTSACWKTH